MTATLRAVTVAILVLGCWGCAGGADDGANANSMEPASAAPIADDDLEAIHQDAREAAEGIDPADADAELERLEAELEKR